jgi:hypothetical protein
MMVRTFSRLSTSAPVTNTIACCFALPPVEFVEVVEFIVVEVSAKQQQIFKKNGQAIREWRVSVTELCVW